MTTSVLTDVTLVLGPPLQVSASFRDFQERASLGEPVLDHAWVAHEHGAVDALTVRAGAISSPTLLEAFVGGALGVNVIIADVERQWVRHADGQLHAAVAFAIDDVRPRAAAVALQTAEAIEVLNRVAGSLSTLDGRAWLAWSSRSVPDTPSDEQTQRTARLMAAIAEAVLTDTADAAVQIPVVAARDADEAGVDLVADLRRAIALGSRHAEQPSLPMVQELRRLRHRDPLRVEWQAVHMDAVFLAAQSPDQIQQRIDAERATGLPFLYVGRDRTERLKADPFITPRFHRELIARSYLTAYVLQRLAPTVSQQLCATMGGSAL